MKISPMKAAILMAHAIAKLGDLKAMFALQGYDITTTGKGRNRHHHMRKSWFSQTSLNRLDTNRVNRYHNGKPHQGKQECERRAKRIALWDEGQVRRP